MLMRSWSIPVGSWRGINVRLHLTFFFLLIFVWFTESGTLDPKIAFLRSLAFTGMVLLAVFLHELGHLLVTMRAGALPRALVLLPIGGLPLMENPGGSEPQASLDVRREIRIAAAGPISSLLLAILCAAIVTTLLPQLDLISHPWGYITNLPRTAVWINVFLAIFNLIPAYPLDGGRVLRALLARHMPFELAVHRTVNIGSMLTVAMILAGMVWSPWLMLAGFCLFLAAQLEERSLLFHSVLETVRMEEVMLTEFSTLSPADTLEDALSKAVHTLQDDFPVVRGGDMVGVVSRKKILTALRGEGNAYVQSIMNRAYEVASRNDSLASAFRKITARGLTIIPIVDQERLVGIVTLQNLMHSMSVLAESKKLRRSQEDGL